jgi:hypothetical protein
MDIYSPLDLDARGEYMGDVSFHTSLQAQPGYNDGSQQ